MNDLQEILNTATYLSVWNKDGICWWNPIINNFKNKPFFSNNRDSQKYLDISIQLTDENLIYGNDIEILVLLSNNKQYYISYPNNIRKTLLRENQESGLKINYMFLLSEYIAYEKDFLNIYFKPLLESIVFSGDKQVSDMQWDLIKNKHINNNGNLIADRLNLSYFKPYQENKNIIYKNHKEINIIDDQPLK